MKSKTGLETINGNGAERQKRTHIVCCMVRTVAIFYAFVLTCLLILPYGNFHGELKGMADL